MSIAKRKNAGGAASFEEFLPRKGASIHKNEERNGLGFKLGIRWYLCGWQGSVGIFVPGLCLLVGGLWIGFWQILPAKRDFPLLPSVRIPSQWPATMGQQSKKIIKRRRRADYLKRKAVTAKLGGLVKKPAVKKAEVAKKAPAKKAAAKKAPAKKVAKKVADEAVEAVETTETVAVETTETEEA